jgi:hypothetical protein
MRNKGEIGLKWEFGDLGRFLNQEAMSQEARSSIQTILTESRFKSRFSSHDKPTNLSSLLKEQHTILKRTGGLGGKGFLKRSLIDKNRVEIIDRSLNKSSLEQYTATDSSQIRMGLKERIASVFCARKVLQAVTTDQINQSSTFFSTKRQAGSSIPHRRTASSISCQNDRMSFANSSKPALNILKNFKEEKDLLLTKLHSPQSALKQNTDLDRKKAYSNTKLKTSGSKNPSAKPKLLLSNERSNLTPTASKGRNLPSNSKRKDPSIPYQKTTITMFTK